MLTEWARATLARVGLSFKGGRSCFFRSAFVNSRSCFSSSLALNACGFSFLASPGGGRCCGRALLWLLILPGVLLYPCLSFYLFEPDEGRYAEIPREMLARGDWVVPHLQGEPYLDKPPLFYWLVMLSYSIFGV